MGFLFMGHCCGSCIYSIIFIMLDGQSIGNNRTFVMGYCFRLNLFLIDPTCAIFWSNSHDIPNIGGTNSSDSVSVGFCVLAHCAVQNTLHKEAPWYQVKFVVNH